MSACRTAGDAPKTLIMLERMVSEPSLTVSPAVVIIALKALTQSSPDPDIAQRVHQIVTTNFRLNSATSFLLVEALAHSGCIELALTALREAEEAVSVSLFNPKQDLVGLHWPTSSLIPIPLACVCFFNR